MTTECPNCEKHFEGSTCPLCRWQVSSLAVLVTSKADHYCTWRTRAGRCRMIGVFQQDAKHQLLCEWHSQEGATERAREDFDEFERWVIVQRQHYCAQFSHDPVVALWSVVQGETALPSSPVPCTDPGCWSRIPLVSLQDTPREYLRKVRVLIRAVEQAHTPPALTAYDAAEVVTRL